MRLKSIHIRDFKRFADLTISDVPRTAKLVVLTGPNGSGKTSLFEAFNYWMKLAARQDWNYDKDYYLRGTIHANVKNNGRNFAQETWNKIVPTFHDVIDDIRNNQEACKKAFYIRSAYRHEPDFTATGLGKLDDILNDSHRASKLILSESRVSDNYQRMVGLSLERLYDKTQRDRTAGQITDELIGEVKNAMQKVFDGLILDGPGNPLEGGTFRFTKGDVPGFHYKNLSGGEKAAFDLLLDFVVKRKTFDDTIYCIDEPELHMHSRLQAKLLEVMFDLIPDDCQLWLSTHSIGMARKAAELSASDIGKVAFIDFHNRDFDRPTMLSPVNPSRQFWRQMFDTALYDLAELVVPKYVIFCEGKRLGQGGRKPSFDVDVYRTIFSPQYGDAEFVPLGGTNEVQHDSKGFGLLLTKMAPGMKWWAVFDRDDRHEEEIRELQAKGTQVLSRRDVESFLWDDEVLEALCAAHESPEKLVELLAEKRQALADGAANGRPADDVKAAAGRLYNKCKSSLSLSQCGNDAEAFARLTLAQLIKPGMKVYRELDDAVMAPCRISNA